MINDTLNRLFELGGSDLLISCGSAPPLRRDGRLEPMHGELLTPSSVECMLRPLLDESQWQQLAAHGSVDFAFT